MEQMIKKLGKKFYLILAAVLVALVVVIAVVAVSCGNGNITGPDTDTSGEGSGQNQTYTVSIKTAGGMALSELDVYVYADESLKDLKQFAKTDANGIVSFSLPESDKYAIAISGAPKGYEVQASYSFKDGTAIISLNSSLITGDDISTAQLGVGDVMYDFTVTTTSG